MTKRIAIFASGRGSNAQAIIDHMKNVEDIDVNLIVCNKDGAGIFDIGREENIHSIHLSKKQMESETEVLQYLSKIDYIVLAGYLLKVPAYLIDKFKNRIINIHPALLPKFGGKGMYGMNVHKAVKEAGEKETGITIHLVDEVYDNGEHLGQFKTTLTGNETPEEIAFKVLQLEHKHFPIAIEEFIKR